MTDTIAAGLSEVFVRPWFMALPLLLDLYYWIGWRFLPAALTERIAKSVSESTISDKQSILNRLDDIGKVDLSGIVGLFMPSMLVGANRDKVFEVWSRPVVSPNSIFLVCLISGVFLLAASLCYMAFLVPLADVVTARRRPWRQIPKAIFSAWLRMLGLQCILLGLVALVFGPILVITALFEVVGVDFSEIVISLSVLSVLAATVFLWFVVAAIAAIEVGPFKAMYLSFNVVRRYFWQTVGLIAASILIGSGLPELWLKLMDTAPGLLIAVVANAFFSVGLSVASLIFFTDRLRLLRFDAAQRTFPMTRRSTV